MSASTISAKQLLENAQANPGLELIDVRTPVEYREVHVEFAKNVPLDQLDPHQVMQTRSAKEQPLYIICKAGGRGKQACDRFMAAGFPNVINIEGGTSACVQAGLPVVRGKKAIALDRQVRITAGSLVLTGAILGYFTLGSLACQPSLEQGLCSQV